MKQEMSRNIVDVRNGAGRAKGVAKALEAAKAMERAKEEAKAMELDGVDGNPRSTVTIAKATSMTKLTKQRSDRVM